MNPPSYTAGEAGKMNYSKKVHQGEETTLGNNSSPMVQRGDRPVPVTGFDANSGNPMDEYENAMPAQPHVFRGKMGTMHVNNNEAYMYGQSLPQVTGPNPYRHEPVPFFLRGNRGGMTESEYFLQQQHQQQLMMMQQQEAMRRQQEQQPKEGGDDDEDSDDDGEYDY